MIAEEITEDQRDLTWSNDWRAVSIRRYMECTRGRDITPYSRVTQNNSDADQRYAIGVTYSRLISFRRPDHARKKRSRTDRE